MKVIWFKENNKNSTVWWVFPTNICTINRKKKWLGGQFPSLIIKTLWLDKKPSVVFQSRDAEKGNDAECRPSSICSVGQSAAHYSTWQRATVCQVFMCPSMTSSMSRNTNLTLSPVNHEAVDSLKQCNLDHKGFSKSSHAAFILDGDLKTGTDGWMCFHHKVAMKPFYHPSHQQRRFSAQVMFVR